jgi:hypothetical protein
MSTISQSLFQDKREEYLFLSRRHFLSVYIMLRGEKAVPIACPSAGAQPSPTFLVNFFCLWEGDVYNFGRAAAAAAVW